MLRTSSTARATGGVTFRLTPASSIVGVAVARPSTGWERQAKSPSSLSRSRASTSAELVKLAVAGGIGGVTLVSLGDEIHHHEPALGNGEVETGRLADDRGIDVAGRLDRAPMVVFLVSSP